MHNNLCPMQKASTFRNIDRTHDALVSICISSRAFGRLHKSAPGLAEMAAEHALETHHKDHFRKAVG